MGWVVKTSKPNARTLSLEPSQYVVTAARQRRLVAPQRRTRMGWLARAAESWVVRVSISVVLAARLVLAASRSAPAYWTSGALG
jgi:hypothetical protein